MARKECSKSVPPYHDYLKIMWQKSDSNLDFPYKLQNNHPNFIKIFRKTKGNP